MPLPQMMNENEQPEGDDISVKLEALDKMLSALGFDYMKANIPELAQKEEGGVCPTCGKPEEECECEEESSMPMAMGKKNAPKASLTVVIGEKKPVGK